MTTAKDPNEDGQRKKSPKTPAKKTAPKKMAASKSPAQKAEDQERRRIAKTPKSKERYVLEQWEGDEFDTTDFKLLTDWSDSD